MPAAGPLPAAGWRLLHSLAAAHPSHTPPHVLQDLKFGTVFTDHMFQVEHVAGRGWERPTVKPFGYLQLHPASQVRG